MRNVSKAAPTSNDVDQQVYEQLQYYTLSHGGAEFVHQYVVDAWAAQQAGEHTKPITLTFALIGLYLHVERGLTGRQVQWVHMELAKHKCEWPIFTMPLDRGSVTVSDVMAAPAGLARDQAIDDWCVSIWNAFNEQHHTVIELLRKHGIT